MSEMVVVLSIFENPTPFAPEYHMDFFNHTLNRQLLLYKSSESSIFLLVT